MPHGYFKNNSDCHLGQGIATFHRKCIEALIRALLSTLSVNLVRLARAAFPETNAMSTVRRIGRLLALGIFHAEAVGKAIVRSLPPQKKYILTMDRTTWELGRRIYNILTIGICFDGISIPIYFTTYDKRGTTNFTEQISFMESALDIIPVHRIECLVADREFGYTNFMRWLDMMKIPYCLRLRENCYVHDPAKSNNRKLKVILSSLAIGQSVVLAHQYIVSGNKSVRIYALRRKASDEDSLLILATPVGSNFTDKMYRLRWQIETAFRAMKTAGFNMEQTHFPINGRFENMLSIVLIAYACAFIEGIVKSAQTSIPIMKSNGRRRFSIFSCGLDIVVTDIWKTSVGDETEMKGNGS